MGSMVVLLTCLETETFGHSLVEVELWVPGDVVHHNTPNPLNVNPSVWFVGFVVRMRRETHRSQNHHEAFAIQKLFGTKLLHAHDSFPVHSWRMRFSRSLALRFPILNRCAAATASDA